MRRLVLAAVVAVALQSSPAGAIVSDPLPRICNEFPHSNYVFSGRVLPEKDVWPPRLHGEGATIYRIRTDRVFKGKVPPIARLQTRNDSARGVLSVGEQSIVFAYKKEGRMAFDGSSNSQSGAGVPKVIAAIRAYLTNPPNVATIAGRIDQSRSVRLALTNHRTTRFVRTDARGTFVAPIPSGNWFVRIAEPGWASRRGIYSYDFAEPLRLKRGGCADVEIETAVPGEKLLGPGWQRWPR